MNGFIRRFLAVLAASMLAASVAAVVGTVDPVDTARASGEPVEPGPAESDDDEGQNETGDGSSDDESDADDESDEAGEEDLDGSQAPVPGESVNAEPEEGDVSVRLPGESEELPISEASSLPVGSIIDARKGAVTLTVASPDGGTQWATFSGAVFKIVQPRLAGYTEVRLVGRRFGPCRARASVFGRSYSPLASASARRRVRRLWASGKGRFRTRGSNGVATVRGTTWMTADSCRGTLVRVRRGVVDVRDLVRKRTVVVRAGQQYLAKPRP